MEQLLIVEDDIGLNQGLCKALKADARQIISCQDLKTAKEQLLCGGVSLILLDINLPDGSGLELLREVKVLPTPAAYPKKIFKCPLFRFSSSAWIAFNNCSGLCLLSPIRSSPCTKTLYRKISGFQKSNLALTLKSHKDYNTFSSFFPFGRVAESGKRSEKSRNFSTNRLFIQSMSFCHITLAGFSIVLMGCTVMSTESGLMTLCFI